MTEYQLTFIENVFYQIVYTKSWWQWDIRTERLAKNILID